MQRRKPYPDLKGFFLNESLGFSELDLCIETGGCKGSYMVNL